MSRNIVAESLSECDRVGRPSSFFVHESKRCLALVTSTTRQSCSEILVHEKSRGVESTESHLYT